MTNREQQELDAAERDEEMGAVADILNDAFGNDPELLRAGMRVRFGEQLDAKQARIGPVSGMPHVFLAHSMYCSYCECRKDWLILIGSKVCSAHTTDARKEAARGAADRP